MEIYAGLLITLGIACYALYRCHRAETINLSTKDEILSEIEDQSRRLYSLIEDFIPMLEILHEKDIDLVIKTDYPDYDLNRLMIKNDEVVIRVISKEVKYLYSPGGMYSDYEHRDIKLSKAKSRATELRKLKSKLCCNKTKSHKGKK